MGLVRYPTTLAPASGTVSVTTQCADNAQRTSSSLSVTCDSSGNWGGQIPQCQCDSGYQTATENGRQICQGTYVYMWNACSNIIILYIILTLRCFMLFCYSCSNSCNTVWSKNWGSSSLSYYTSSSQWNSVCDYTVCWQFSQQNQL